ncbi:hypothetical protein D3C71_1049190 [compost metagenome]
MPGVIRGVVSASLCQNTLCLQTLPDGVIDGADIDTAMGKGDAGVVRIVPPVGEIVTHEVRTGLLSVIGKTDGVASGVIGESLRCTAGGKGDRGLSLPVLFLATDFGQFDGARPLGYGTEGRARTDCLQLLVITDQHQLGATRLDLPDETAKLPAADHAGLVDDQNVLVAEDRSAVLPAKLPRRQRARGNA